MTVRLVVDPTDAAIPSSLLAEIHDPVWGRAVVLADPDRNVLTILRDVLLGIGPDRDGCGWPRTIESARDWVGAWLQGREIRELVIAHADALTEQQLAELHDVAARRTGLWLVARKAISASEHRFEDVSVDAFVAHFDLVRERTVLPPEELSRFPRVPLSGILTFRRTCHQLLSPEEFWIVDNLLHRSCYEAQQRLIDIQSSADDAAWTLIEPALRRDYPADGTITVLRGYQLAAFVSGLHLTFDAHRLYAQLRARGRLNQATADLLTADPDPAAAAMLVMETLGASPDVLESLKLDALDAEARRIRLADGVRSVPPAVAHILATHYQARVHASAGRAPETTPLFARRNDPNRAPSARTINGQLRRAATRLGIARNSAEPIDPRQFTLVRFPRYANGNQP
jgi:hypothetical protein